MSCAVKGCKSYYAKRGSPKEVSFHRFPVDQELKKEWIKCVNRRGWTWNTHSRICSKHFTSDSFMTISNMRRLKAFTVPTLNLPNLEDDNTCWKLTNSNARPKPLDASIKEPSKGTAKPYASPKQADQHTDEAYKVSQHTDKEPCASRELLSVKPVQLHEEYLIQADHGFPNAEQDPLLSKLEQCRFCGEFSKECLTINDNKPYITDNKTVFTLNGISIKLDFREDSLTRAVCRDCDVKLHDIVNFVNVVKATQDALTKVADDYNVIEEYTNDGEDGGLEYVKQDIFRDKTEHINTPEYHSINDKANGDCKEIKNRKLIKEVFKASSINNTNKRKLKVDIEKKPILTVAKDGHFNDEYEKINERVNNDEVNKNIHYSVKVNTSRKRNDEKDNNSLYFKANTGNKEIKNRKIIKEIFKPSLTNKNIINEDIDRNVLKNAEMNKAKDKHCSVEDESNNEAVNNKELFYYIIEKTVGMNAVTKRKKRYSYKT